MTDFRRSCIAQLNRFLPRRVFLLIYGTYACAKNAANLLGPYGFLRSAFRWESADRSGSPIPWFTYPAFEYIDQLDLSDKSVFEYGCGFSTMYWSRKASRVQAVEDDEVWQKAVSSKVASNTSIVLAHSPEEYANAITKPGGSYDVIIVDAAAAIRRLDCAKVARPFLRDGGFIILDDAEDNTDAAEYLRSTDLIEVDFSGFNPINSYTKTTSLFIHRSFRPKINTPFPVPSLCHPHRAKQNRN